MENANSREYLEKIKVQVIENLRNTAHAPSVQMTDIPRTDIFGGTEEDDDILDDRDDDENPDTRLTQRKWEARITRDDELYESDDEVIAAANGVKRQNGTIHQKGVVNWGKPDVDMDSPVAFPQVPTATDIAAALATEVNAEVNDEVMAAKSRELTAALAAAEAGLSNAPSRSHSRAPIDKDGDVEMGDSATEPATQDPVAPTPLSPAASIHTSIPALADAVTAVPSIETKKDEEAVPQV